MAQRTNYPGRNSLVKRIGGKKIYLGKTWDLKHGYGWFCQVFNYDFKFGFGFHKTNKFSAVRIAIEDMKISKL